MTEVASMPGNWPRDTAEMEDELFIPPLRLPGTRRTRRSTPYLLFPQPRETSIPTESTLQRREIEEMHRNQRQAPYPFSPDDYRTISIREQTPNSGPTQPPNIQDELFIPRLALRVDTLSMQAGNSSNTPVEDWEPHSSESELSPNLTPGDTDELFFECSPISTNGSGEGSLQPFVALNSVTAEDIADWRGYEAPQELQRVQNGTSPEIEGILASSVERIRRRYAEEDERRATSARDERPLNRTRKSVRPSRVPLSEASSHPLEPSYPENDLSTIGLALSPHDSGYGSSISPGTDASPSPTSASRRKFAGLSSIFKRKDKLRSRPKSSQENHDITNPIRAVATAGTPPTQNLQPEPWMKECVSCLDDFPSVEMIKLPCHSYCSACFHLLINNALETETHWPPKCCLTPIPTSKILPHIPSPMKEKYRQQEAEWTIPTADRIYCSSPRCSTWIPPSQITTATHSATCPTCSNATCTICRGAYHANSDCPSDTALLATINLAEVEGWKRCYSCHALVEHNHGCSHMTCRCKAQFCYICSARWKTCGCTESDLVHYIARTAARREEQGIRNERARLEAEEERAAIEAVEAFMRQEAEAAAREAEIARQRAEEEARRREEERIAIVDSRYRFLGDELETLHDVQRVLISERHDFESEGLDRNRQGALDTLNFRHRAEEVTLKTESSAKISAAEAMFEKEYHTRLAEEQRIENEYVAQLEAYWTGRPDGETKIREAMNELRMDQEREYKVWDSYRRTQLLALREGEKRIMETLRGKHETEVKVAEMRAQKDRVEWKKKRWAEGKWVEEVVRERGLMLQELEQEEYARGA